MIPNSSDRTYWRDDTIDDVHTSDEDIHDDPSTRYQCTKEDANLVSSLCYDELHRPCIDIDLPCKLVPTSTPGHFHLYIEKGMTWDAYATILVALAEAGVCGHKYVELALERKATYCRPEGVYKPKCDPDEGNHELGEELYP